MKFAPILLLLGFTLFSTAPVKAQEFVIPGKTITKTTTTRTFSDPNLPADIKAKMHDGIRYTVGTTQANGWERGLVKGTPNLKNYFWCSMPKSNQAWSSSKTKTQTTVIPPQVRKFHYNNPGKVKMVNPNIKMPPPPEAPRQVASRSENRADVNTQAVLKYKKTEAPKAYKAYPTNDISSDMNLSGSIVSKEGRAKLLTPTKRKY
ncbi:MAG: hypothetical protein SFY67_14460 [Candidatus Melainabacteria bacterium]|nr:hypothetical protein [Candidatus Melainabacteria bacterium]